MVFFKNKETNFENPYFINIFLYAIVFEWKTIDAK